jgi:anti-sigma B factor antagonist
MTGFDDDGFREPVKTIECKSSPFQTIVVRPGRNLDANGGAGSLLQMVALLEPGVHLTVDLSEVDFVDAAGLSALVGSVRRVRALGGTAELRRPRAGVRRRMELVGMNRLLIPSPIRIRDEAVVRDQAVLAAS